MNCLKLKPLTLLFSDGPGIPRLHLRRFAGEADYRLIASIVQQSYNADGLDRYVQVDDVAQFFERPHNFDPQEDALFVQVGPQAVGFLSTTWRCESGGDRIYQHEGYLLPAWRRKGIGRAMLDHAERRLGLIASEHPTGGRKLLRAMVDDKEIGKLALLKSSGYVPSRHIFSMVRVGAEDLPEAPLPSGIEIRPAGPEHYRSVWDAMVEAFADHWGHFPPTEEHYQRWLENRRFQPELWTVAWEGEQIVGMILNFIDEEENLARNRKRGYTEDISVRRPWRRRGLARAMLVRSIRRLMEQGMSEVALGVDTDSTSGALRLYTSVGYEPVRDIMFFDRALA